MFLAATSMRVSPRIVPVMAARRSAVLGATRMMTIGDTYSRKEKVEEDRYMRSLEAKFLERKKAEKLNAMKEEETAIFQETIAPAMAQAKVLLERTGDTISDAGLEALAKWKLDM